MKQMYLLTVIVNLWVGLWFILPWLGQRYPIFLDLKTFADRIPLSFKMGFSIFLFALGLIKLLFFSYELTIIGDLFPACTLKISSVVFLSEVLQERPETLPLQPKWLHIIEMIQNKQTFIGFLCLGAGVGHFLLSDILFL